MNAKLSARLGGLLAGGLLLASAGAHAGVVVAITPQFVPAPVYAAPAYAAPAYVAPAYAPAVVVAPRYLPAGYYAAPRVWYGPHWHGERGWHGYHGWR